MLIISYLECDIIECDNKEFGVWLQLFVFELLFYYILLYLQIIVGISCFINIMKTWIQMWSLGHIKYFLCPKLLDTFSNPN
jgi:hypothetical protein